MTAKQRQTAGIATWVGGLSGLLLVAHQLVDLRGKVRAQDHKTEIVASSVATAASDQARTRESDRREIMVLQGRVARLERVLRRGATSKPIGGLGATVRPDTMSGALDEDRSPGPAEVLGKVVAAPFKAAGAVWRWFTKPQDEP